MTAPENTPPVVEAPPAPPAQAPAETPPTTDWQAESRKWESRAKENKTAADRLAEMEEASKSEQQKLVERAERAEKAVETANRLVAQNRTALRHGMSEDESSDMSWSGTDDEIDARAKRVVERRVAPVEPPAPPRGAVDQGSRGNGTAGPAQLTESDLKSMSPSQIVKAQADGLCDDLLGIKR